MNQKLLTFIILLFLIQNDVYIIHAQEVLQLRENRNNRNKIDNVCYRIDDVFNYFKINNIDIEMRSCNSWIRILKNKNKMKEYNIDLDDKTIELYIKQLENKIKEDKIKKEGVL